MQYGAVVSIWALEPELDQASLNLGFQGINLRRPLTLDELICRMGDNGCVFGVGE